MESVYIVMPAYNEESNIGGVIRAWYPLLSGKSENSRLVVADSGSQDKTHDILLDLQKSHPKQLKPGPGSKAKKFKREYF